MFGCWWLAAVQLAEEVASGDGPNGAAMDALELGAWLRGSSSGTRSLDLCCESLSPARFVFSQAPIKSWLALLLLLLLLLLISISAS